MAPDEMLDLARRTAELLVERTDNLAASGAWDGEFKQGLEQQLPPEPPEQGRPAEEVLELRGIERADSIGLDAHKWFFQPYEAGCLLVKDAGTLEDAFAVPHDMLQDTIWGANHPNFSDRGLQHSRSFKALKIWMSVQTFGISAFRRAVSLGLELARRAEDYIRKSRVLEILNPASLGIVCFRVCTLDAGLDETSVDRINRKVLARLFWEDRAFISSTNLKGTFSLRMCIVNHTTTWDDVRGTIEAIERFGAEALDQRRA